MANETFTANQTTVLTPGFDADNDGVIDPGERVTTTVTITNNSTAPTPTDATGVTFTETLNGMTLVDQPGALDNINVSPITFDDGGYTTAGNVPFTAAVSVLANDTEPLGPEGLALNTGTALQNTGVAFATSQGGTVTLNADGTFTYLSAVGFEGTDTFTYTLRDTGLDGVAGNADDLISSAGTVSITVGPSVWFIDNTAAPGGNGSEASPFNTIAAFNAAQGTANGPDAGDFIYLRFGTGTYSEADGINLGNNQTLIGAGQNLVVNGVTIETATAAPTIQVTGAGEGVQLAQNNTLSGFDISSTNAAADGIEDGGGTVGTLTISDVSISGTGQAVDIDQGGTLNVTLDSVASTGATEEGIQLVGVAGSFTAITVSLNGMAGDAVDLDSNSATVAINGGTIGNSNDPGGIGVDIAGGTGNVTINATINDATAANAVVEVSGRTAGTVDFNGNITSTGGGISLTGNTGGTVRFDGGMNLSTGGNAAFSSTGGSTGATLVVTDPGAGSNILATTTGTALNVANTTIGAEDLTFQSISSIGGSATGIILDTTGSAGGLHVTGTGGAGSGGTIASKTGADGSTTNGIGIYLNNTTDVQFNWMQLNDLQNFGIKGTDVTGFIFDNSAITGTNGTTGGAFDEAAISFNNLLGSASISNSNIANGFEFILKVLNSSGTLNRLTIDNTDFGTNNTGLGGDAVQFVASNTATANITVTNSGFTNAREDLFNAVATQTANMDVVFRDNTLSNNHTNMVSAASNILVFSTSTGNVSYDISHNTLTTGATGSAIAAAKGVPDSGSGGTMSGTINANTIGLAGVVGSGSQFTGIFASALGSGTHTTAITNNIIRHYNEEGIFLKANDNLTGGDSVLNATVTGNQTLEPDSLAFTGLWVVAGSGSGSESNIVNIVVGNNSTAPVAGSPTGSLQNDFTAGDPANGSDVFLQESGSASVINLSRAGSGSGTAAGVIQDDNVGTPTVVASGTVNLVNTLPATPPPVSPLLAAPGGIDAAPTEASTPPQDEADIPSADTAPTPIVVTPPVSTEPPTTAPLAHPVIVDDGVLTQAELDYFVDAAIARWSEAGLTTVQVDALKAMTFNVADMSGLNLGAFSPSQIRLDADAAGRGWYLDGTPLDDAEFGTIFSATWLQTSPTGAPAGHYDLLTTIMHEMGHALGLGDSYASADRDELMYGWLYTGERRLPGDGEADGAVAGAITSEEFLGAPIDIGVLPAGKTVTIQWQATVDPQSNGLIVNPVNTGTVTATNTPPAFPDASTNTVTTTLDTLILGGTVWNDNGAGGGTAANGILDGSEPGVSGVQLSLFVDANDDNVPDSPASPIATTPTAGGGTYSFTGLAPDNYIVRVDADNFTGVGALAGLQVSPVTSPEPPDPDTGDPDVDNDDNGSRAANQPAFSNAITIAYNTEPTAGTGNDSNTTLDFGFFSNPASIQVVKFVNGQDADSPTGPHVAAGSTVTFTYVVTNTGNVPLANVAVTDDKLGSIIGFTGDTNTNSLLDLTETWTYTQTATALAGQQTNVGTVTAQDVNPPGTTATDDNPANYFGDAPAINIVKFVNGQDADSATGPHVPAGSTVTFTYVVTNTGNVPLANVAVTDDKLGPITSFTGDTNTNGLLDLTEAWIYTQTATALLGQQTNVGTVTGQDANSPPGTPATDDNPANYFGDGTPAINIVKFVNGQDADSPTGPHVAAGSTVTFTYVVTNTGNVPLANVAVTDDKLGSIIGFTGDTNTNSLLDLTETWTYTQTATALAGQQTNVGTVTAQDANPPGTTATDDNPANYFGDDSVPPTVTINQAAGQTDPANLSPILYTVTFSEPVTGFTGSDISFAGSTVGGTLVANVSGSGANYTVTVTGMSGTGTVVASIPAGAAADLASNTSLASTSIDNSVSFSSDVGTSGNDMLVASNAGAQSLDGLAGDDTLVGQGSGTYQLNGGDGNDQINLQGSGAETASGGDGNDLLNGTGNGSYFLEGWNGNDSLYATGNGSDTLHGSAGNDALYASGTAAAFLFGDDGNDTVIGAGSGAHSLAGGNNDDQIYAQGTGAESGYGGAGNDLLGAQGDGSYLLDGGTGNNILYASGNGNDTLIGGAGSGSDKLSASGTGTYVLDASGATGDSSLYSSGSHNDTLTGGAGNDQLTGAGSGAYSMSGGLGNDYLNATGSGGSSLFGGAGNDLFLGSGSGNYLMDGGIGNDSIYGTGGGNETLIGGDGNDALYVSGSGNDSLSGDDGADTLYGAGGGLYTLDGGIGNDLAYLQGSAGETATGGAGDDIFDGSGSGNYSIDGGTGNDSIYGTGSGNDTLVGGDGNDVFLTSSGTDTVNGGNDNDTIYFASNSGQNDTLDGGAGTADKVIFQGKATTNIVSESTDGSGVTTIIFDAAGGGQTVFVQNVETLQFTNGTQTNPPGFPNI